jgi:predicted metal-dependent hydrolase
LEELLLLEREDYIIPIQLRKAGKKNVRFTFNTKGGHVSIPPFVSSSKAKAFFQRGLAWTEAYIEANPNWISTFSRTKYKEGNQISSAFKVYTIKRLPFEGKIKAKISGQEILLKIPDDETRQFQQLVQIRTSIQREVVRDLKPQLIRLVEEINRQTLQVQINQINLRYNHSNWGSCSTNSNLSFSSRLLLAEKWVISSVIKHELAHFKEMNHSPLFWKLVEQIDPDYKKANKWLKMNSYRCDY